MAAVYPARVLLFPAGGRAVVTAISICAIPHYCGFLSGVDFRLGRCPPRSSRPGGLAGRKGWMTAATAGTAPPVMTEVEFSIRGMTCAACAARVEKKLSGLDGVAAAVNFATGKATVTAPASVPVARLIEVVEQAGYGADLPQPLAGAPDPGAAGPGSEAARVAYLRRRLIVALVFFVPLSDLSLMLSLFPWPRFPGW